jgi:predicted nucleic acid-binding protein
LSIDLAASLRRIKPEKHRVQLRPRKSGAFFSVSDIPPRGRAALLLDTNVYIHSAAGTLHRDAAALLDGGLLYHCSVCVAELSTGIANARSSRPDWNKMRDYYEGLISRMPSTRLLTPDADIWTQAGIIAGTLSRCQGFQPHQRKECLNDALIYLTAAKAGLPVLTADRDDFDLIQQLAAEGHFLYF